MAEISLSSDSAVSTEGYFVLSWTSDSDEALSLQQASDPDFSSVKTTTLPATGSITITGLVDGDYYFRLRDADQQSSNILRIEVAHHSMTRALAFFALGLVLFVILLLTIYIGNRGRDEA